MSREPRIEELVALKEIAESLNGSNDMHQMLDDVLKKLLEIAGLTTGWIFLVDEEPEYICVVDHNLPPALTIENKQPMCTGGCWCLDRFWDGRLKKAVNIIECARIENAIKYNWGDTAGIVHHATVPIEASGKMIGILNVAAPAKERFSQKELALLQAVSYQIGTAINRTRLYQAQIKRAENYEKLGEITQALNAILDLEKIPSRAVEKVGEIFGWPNVSFFLREGNALSLRAHYENGEVKKMWKAVIAEQYCPIGKAFYEEQRVVICDKEMNRELESIGLPGFRSAVAEPIRLRDHLIGVLFVSSEKKNQFDEQDLQLIHDLAEHISLAMENARLYEQKRELVRMEERNRLARDLHDSVCQTLFSLSLMAKGTEALLKGQNQAVNQSLAEIQKLSQSALKEMRSLIWQLRPAGLEQGLLTALKRYGESLGLTIHEKKEGVRELPRPIEEALWRIGQESLNNISKHAGTDEAYLELTISGRHAHFSIRDYGVGFHIGQSGNGDSMGMISMRERAEILGGTFSIKSVIGEGTEIQVRIPFSTDYKQE